MVRVDFSDRSIDDLGVIFRYGVRHWGIDLADEYVDELRAAIHELGAYPEGGEVFRRQRGIEIRRLVHRYHVAFYMVDGESVLVLRIRSGRARILKWFDLRR